MASRATFLTPQAMNMFLSRTAAATEDLEAAEEAVADTDVQGLTQMYSLAEEDTSVLASSPASSAGVGGTGLSGINRRAAHSLGKRQLLSTQAFAAAATPSPFVEEQSVGGVGGVPKASPASSTGSGVVVGAAATQAFCPLESVAEKAGEMSAEPQGFTQAFFLNPEDEEKAVEALPVVPGRSFLSERLGVSGEVVQDLRQVGYGAGDMAWYGQGTGGRMDTAACLPAREESRCCRLLWTFLLHWTIGVDARTQTCTVSRSV